jgi:hypothetical protein
MCWRREDNYLVLLIATALISCVPVGLYIVPKFEAHKLDIRLKYSPFEDLEMKLHRISGTLTSAAVDFAQLHMIHNRIGITKTKWDKIVFVWGENPDTRITFIYGDEEENIDDFWLYLPNEWGEILKPCDKRGVRFSDPKKFIFCTVMRQLQILSNYRFMDDPELRRKIPPQWIDQELKKEIDPDLLQLYLRVYKGR